MEQWNKFRPFRKNDLAAVWKTLRPEDLREFEALNLANPALIEHYILSSGKRMQTWDSELGPLAVLGITPDAEPGVGCVWAIASTLAVPRWRFAVRETEPQLKRLGRGYRLLYNFKDARNTAQIHWLRRLGFTFFHREENFGGSNLPFLQFARIVK